MVVHPSFTPESTLAHADELKSGDLEVAQKAFTALHTRFNHHVKRVIQGTDIQRSYIDDIAQETWAKIWEKRLQLNHPEAFSSWLSSIARHIAISHIQRNPLLVPYPISSERDDYKFIDTIQDLGTQSPLDTMVNAEVAGQVRNALGALGSSDDRKALVAYYFDDDSYVEMQEMFECPLGTIKRRLNVARLRLRKILDPEGRIKPPARANRKRSVSRYRNERVPAH